MVRLAFFKFGELNDSLRVQEGQRAKKGVFITTSTFTKDAWEYVEHTEKKIVLIDGEELALLMIEHNVGVASVSSYDVKKVDIDYFGIE